MHRLRMLDARVSRIPQCSQNWLPGRKVRDAVRERSVGMLQMSRQLVVARCRHLRLWGWGTSPGHATELKPSAMSETALQVRPAAQATVRRGGLALGSGCRLKTAGSSQGDVQHEQEKSRFVQSPEGSAVERLGAG